LAELRKDFHVLPADEFIHKLRRRFPIESTEAARHLGSHRLANLERFFRRLTNSLKESDGGPQTVLRSLRRSVAEGMDESEAAPGDQSMDAVRIMTIHKAKGLTFPHVYLVNLHAGVPSGSGKKTVAVGKVGDQTEFQLFGMSTLGWAAVQIHGKRLEAAERVRLLYVALTRPKYRLVVAGKRCPSKPPNNLAAAETMDGLLQFRPQQPDLLNSFQQNAGQSFEVTDAVHALWYFPNPSTGSLAQAPKATLADPDLTSDFPLFAVSSERTVSQILQGLQSLRSKREQAKRHQQIPLTSTASGAVSHEQLRHSMHGGEGIDVGLASYDSILHSPDADRQARATGTAVHRALELIDLQLSPEEALELQLNNLPQSLNGFISPDDLPQVVTLAKQVLQQMDNNGLLHELFERRTQILGREIPILLHSGASASIDSKNSSIPLGAYVGTLDLLYRDPADGQLVVADFKTDQVPNVDAIRQLASAYSAQGEIYCAAVESMFPNEEPPRFELWFLRAGVIRPA
jgi:ATP-dependent exoDNAse (exonuclease V) beta subunit